MVNVKYLVFNVFIVHTLGAFYGFLIFLSFLYRFIRHPINFTKKAFIRKKRETPNCLQDPSLGTHGFIHLQDVKIHYVANGSEDKPLMLLVHGFPEFWFSWRHQLREFYKEYRVVAFDMRGYNDSDKPSGFRNYYLQDLLKDIKQLIPALGYQKCVLVGHDWGGLLVWAFAAVYPEMVDKLIVMNAPHPATFRDHIRSSIKQFLASWYIMFFQVPFLPELMFKNNDFKALEGLFKKGPHSPQMTKLSEEEIEAYKFCFSKPKGFTGPINYYRAAVKNPDHDKGSNGKKIQCPVLLIWGCKDQALTITCAEQCKTVVPHLQIKYIADASHWVQMDAPQEVNAAMWNFLKQE